MKFLLIVLALRFAAWLIVSQRNKEVGNISENASRDIRHPAEFELR